MGSGCGKGFMRVLTHKLYKSIKKIMKRITSKGPAMLGGQFLRALEGFQDKISPYHSTYQAKNKITRPHSITLTYVTIASKFNSFHLFEIEDFIFVRLSI